MSDTLLVQAVESCATSLNILIGMVLGCSIVIGITIVVQSHAVHKEYLSAIEEYIHWLIQKEQ